MSDLSTMNYLSIIPQDEREEFGHLPDGLKDEFKIYFKAFSEIARAKRKCDAVRKHAGILKVSESTLYNKFRLWTNTRNWRVLFNKAKAGSMFWNSTDESLAGNKDFVHWFYGFAGTNQRKFRPQIRAFHRRWRAWLNGDASKAFPGFDVCPADCGKGYPVGMSERNLYSLLKKRPKAQTVMQRIGTAAAMEFLPPVPFSRVGVRPLEYVFFDDVWLDHKVIVPGHGVCRLLQLGCLDLCSGVYLKFGQRPETRRDDQTRERLKYRDMKWLTAMFLEEYGYPLDYRMHLIVENATATLYKAEAQALYDLTNGQICVCYTGMEGQLVLAWKEAQSGKPTGKAHLESWHNLFHNENGALPGQMGKDRDHSPAALYGMEREAAALQTAEHFLTPEQRERIVYPFSDWRAAYFETLEVVNRINHRLKHDLTDFDKVGIWRVNAPGLGVQPWRQDKEGLEKLDPALRQFVEWNNRLETPMERLLRMSNGVRFAKIPNDILPRFYEDCHKLESIKPDGSFRFQFDDKTYSYYPPTLEDALPAGKEFLGYFRPFDMGVIHLTEKTNHGPRYVATWQLHDRFNPGDAAAKAKAYAFQQSFVSKTIASVRRQNREFIETQEGRLKQNMATLADADLIPSQLNNPLCTSLQTVTTPTAAALQREVEKANTELAKAKTIEQRMKAADCVDVVAEQLKRAKKQSEESAPEQDWSGDFSKPAAPDVAAAEGKNDEVEETWS